MESYGTRMSTLDSGGAATAGALDRLVGRSLDIWFLREHLAKFGPLSAPVLVHGETGTGKELVARALHDLSARRDGPFVAVNCGGLSESLLEDTLFGHEKGSFTGADASRAGVFEQAHGGTLFLDEIGELPLLQQAALLRVLDHKVLRRVGGNADVVANFRLVAATNKNISKMAKKGTFRLDLYHRLAALELHTTALRRRRDDIAPIAHHLLGSMEVELGARRLADSAVRWLEVQQWPGNVRELKNALYRAAALTSSEILRREDFEGLGAHCAARSHAQDDGKFRYRIDAFSDRQILDLLKRHDGNITAAARELGVPRTSLRDRRHRIPRSAQGADPPLSLAS